MMKKRTLRDEIIRAKAEAFLTKMGAPVTPLDAPVETPLMWDPEEIRAQAEATIQYIDHFFQQLGFSEERQEELFSMPAIKESLDEIMATVTRERMELERLFGKPRDGWQKLPYESEITVEPVLETPKVPEPIKEIHVTEVCEARAAEQLAAIQEKLALAFETVQEIQRQKIPELPKIPVQKRPEHVASAPIEVPVIEKPQLRKNEDITQHYADQLQIVVDTDPLGAAIEKTRILKNSITTPEPGRSADEILATLDALSQKPEPEKIVEPEVIEPEAVLQRTSSTTRHGNVFLTTLRAQQQREIPEKSLAETILENVTSTEEPVDGTEHRLASTLRRGGFRRISL